MKLTDIVGFTAILGAGIYYGYQAQPALVAGTATAGVIPPYFTAMDYAVILGLLAVGFYFAVILS
jgi:hypothetical protein